jgi:hypothetical protein
MIYTPGMVRKALSEYQRLAQGARMRPPEARLGTRPPPLDEAPWAGTARLKSDLEQALRALSFERMQILFMTLCLGKSTWANGCKPYLWRMRVADWWGRAGDDDDNHGAMTPGDVNKMNDESIEMICDFLNVDTVNDTSLPMLGRLADGKSETVIEHDPLLVDSA